MCSPGRWLIQNVNGDDAGDTDHNAMKTSWKQSAFVCEGVNPRTNNLFLANYQEQEHTLRLFAVNYASADRLFRLRRDQDVYAPEDLENLES